MKRSPYVKSEYGESLEAMLKAADRILTQVFGHNSFRSGQREVIANILKGGNTIAIFPTSGGKSICYQIPAMILPGTTLVISPLISLMKDQVDSLTARKVPSTYISSTLSDHEVYSRIEEMKRGRFKIVYIAPERFYSEEFMNALKHVHIPFIAVDEAHCISQWGHNFRPAYLKIKNLIRIAGYPVTAAFTATANKKVQEDMIHLLGLGECHLFISSFDRSNLEFRIEFPGDSKAFILNHIRRHPDHAGIIYASTRRNVEEIYYFLKNHGCKAGMYHAGLGSEMRNTFQEKFINGTVPVITATNAFGMGINKLDVRFIIHYNMPKSIENYYQEAGRAGRDGKKAVCILLKTPGDYRLNKFLIDNNYPSIKTVERVYRRLLRRGSRGIPVELLVSKKAPDSLNLESALRKLIEYNYVSIKSGVVYPVSSQPLRLSQQDINSQKGIEIEKLDAMQSYYEEKNCLRAYILKYFNEKPQWERCGNCSVCLRTAHREDGFIDRLISNILNS
jgi:ATP-dependent DNA helicase RecQ